MLNGLAFSSACPYHIARQKFYVYVRTVGTEDWWDGRLVDRIRCEGIILEVLVMS